MGFLTSVSRIRCKFKKKQKSGVILGPIAEGVGGSTAVEGKGKKERDGQGEELIDLDVSMMGHDAVTMSIDGVRNRGPGSLDDPPRQVSYLSIFANTKRRHSYSCIPGVYGRATVSPPANPVNEFSRTAPSSISNTGRGEQRPVVGVERSVSSRSLRRYNIPHTNKSSSAKSTASFLKKDGSPGQTSFTSIRAKLQLESRNTKIKKSRRRKEKKKRRKVIWCLMLYLMSSKSCEIEMQ